MTPNHKIPDDPVGFIRRCLGDGRVYWTYHVNMRLASRGIGRTDVLQAAADLQLLEAYPEDKYLPSYLLLAQAPPGPVHLLCAVDIEGDNVRIVTAYRPDPTEWGEDMKKRRTR